ncbi:MULTISPECIES: hypothetical protein [Nannocystis]|uniref:Uncharacterized protein n=1 Tax=Nannocystis radixulma TaxID=2995305 RepID=A0ABT5BNM4_9BACT|nr:MULTISPECIES: hypothetical protein [Nannocystis]MCY1062659.1 hypothetical protein [Nannocystis sp. SCPEA4]MDC0674541.1 hypothetical protein [Nannocystis radixulma]
MQDGNQLAELEQLDVIESNELKVGNAFHAFRFAVVQPLNELDERTFAVLKEASVLLAKQQGIDEKTAQQRILDEAGESNPIEQVSRHVIAHSKLFTK